MRPTRRAKARDGGILSVRVEPRHRKALRRVMRDHGLKTESDAARFLIERQDRQAAAIDGTLQFLAKMGRRSKGRLVDASEDHDTILPGTEH